MRGFLKILIVCLPVTISSKNWFWPDKEEKVPMQREEVTFYSLERPGSNERIARKGLLTLKEDAPATILILHGFGGDKFEVGPLRLLLKKYNVMTFDFRAHGENRYQQQSTIGHDEVYDVFGAVDYLKSRAETKDKPIIAFGLSMGAATAIEAQALDPSLFKALFLDTPFSTSDAFVQKIADGLRFTLFGYTVNIFGDLVQRFAFTAIGQGLLKGYIKIRYGGLKVETFVKPIYPIDSIKKINVPMYFVVCRGDEKIPYEEVLKLYEAHPGITRLAVTGGRRHCDSLFFVPEAYKKLLNGFIKDVISGAIYKQKKKEIKEIMVDAKPDTTEEMGN